MTASLLPKRAAPFSGHFYAYYWVELTPFVKGDVGASWAPVGFHPGKTSSCCIWQSFLFIHFLAAQKVALIPA